MDETPDYEALNRNLDEKIGAGVILISEGIARLQTANAALFSALEELAEQARDACDARRFPGMTNALSDADAALKLARQP